MLLRGGFLLYFGFKTKKVDFWQAIVEEDFFKT